jgi:hypothetical protein
MQGVCKACSGGVGSTAVRCASDCWQRAGVSAEVTYAVPRRQSGDARQSLVGVRARCMYVLQHVPSRDACGPVRLAASRTLPLRVDQGARTGRWPSQRSGLIPAGGSGRHLHPSTHLISHAPLVCILSNVVVHGARCCGAKGRSRARQAGIPGGARWGRGAVKQASAVKLRAASYRLSLAVLGGIARPVGNPGKGPASTWRSVRGHSVCFSQIVRTPTRRRQHMQKNV